MRVIDLINRIANGEEIPNKIKYDGETYKFENVDYYNIYSGTSLLRKIVLDSFYLLKEIEIIEEDKKIEHAKNYLDFAISSDDVKFSYLYKMGTRIMDKINKMEDK